MDWVKLATDFYRDPKVMRAGEAAEVLFTRGLAYCGLQETGGRFPREALLLVCPVKPGPRVKALVREGLWVERPDGWEIPGWDDWQENLEQIRARREAGRRRAAAHRRRHSNGDSNAVTNGARDSQVTATEVEREVDTAAAAAGNDAAAAAELPGSIAVFRSKVQGYTALRALRFDRLTPETSVELEHLIDVHGDQVLVDVALRTCRTPPPVHVTAFLGTWSALPEPGQRLKVIAGPNCDKPGHNHEPAERCRYCTADRLAGEA